MFVRQQLTVKANTQSAKFVHVRNLSPTIVNCQHALGQCDVEWTWITVHRDIYETIIIIPLPIQFLGPALKGI